MESLRQSIAQFKEQQRRQMQSQQQPQLPTSSSRLPGRGGNDQNDIPQPVPTSGGVRHNFEEDFHSSVRRGVPPQHPSRASYEEEEDQCHYEVSAGRPSRSAVRGKPEWNTDTDLGDGDNAPSPVQQRAAQPSANNPSRKRLAADTAFTASKVAVKKGRSAAAVAHHPGFTPPSSTSGGDGARSSGIVSFDDTPVRAGINSNTVWNEYPIGGGPHASGHGGRGAAKSIPNTAGGWGGMNKEISAEAAAAAAEPTGDCSCCGRNFRLSVLSRHEAVCKKQARRPRKVFDTQGMRMDGVDGLQEVMRSTNYNGNAKSSPKQGVAAASKKMPKWKIQHEQFQAAMRAVQQQRLVEQGHQGMGGGEMMNMKSGKAGPARMGPLPPPPAPLPSELDDRVPCPHCGRKFAEDVANRHIPKCATTVAKPKGIRPIRR